MTALVILAVLASTAILFGYLAFIWWLDRYEREPFWMVLLVLGWGAFGGTSLGCLFTLPFALVAAAAGGEAFSTAFSAILVAPIAEEITKGLVFVVLVATRHLDNETDGLIYGAAAGLGFAAIENLAYFAASAGDGPGVLLAVIFMRTFFSALVHCISSALLGMCIGYAVHRPGRGRWLLWPAVGLALAAIKQGLWNALAIATEFEVLGERSPLLIGFGMLLVAGASVLMFLLTQLSLAREHAVIKQHLLREAEIGTLPAVHAGIIPYWTRRRRGGWLPARIPKERYLRAATLLAFRRHQFEIARGERAAAYAAEIHRLRGEVRGMLG